MRGQWCRVGALVALALAAGCTGTDVLNTGFVEVEFATSNTGTGAYECALVDFAGIKVVPLDPTSQVPGGQQIELLAVPFVEAVNFASQPCTLFHSPAPRVILSPGRYRIVSFELKTLHLFDLETGAETIFQPQQDIDIVSDGVYGDLSFTVDAGRGNTILIVLTNFDDLANTGGQYLSAQFTPEHFFTFQLP